LVCVILCICMQTCLALHVEQDPTTYSVKFLAPKSIQKSYSTNTQSSQSTNVTCHLLHLGPTQQHRLLGKENELIFEARPQAHEIDHEHEEKEERPDTVHIFEV
jgi:hypothetical protein